MKVTAKAVLSRYNLCAACQRRCLGAPIGRVNSAMCDLCEGICDRVPRLIQLAEDRLRKYEFETFLVGTRLPSALIEKEDYFRAEFKLRTGQTLKAYLNRTIGTALAESLEKRSVYYSPDVAVYFEPVTESVIVASSPLWVKGRYVKKRRGIPQKSGRCSYCRGEGCASCQFTGLTDDLSVERILVTELKRMLKADRARIIWLGSEAADSLVLGNGRPFYARITGARVRSKLKRTFRKKGITAKMLTTTTGPPGEQNSVSLVKVTVTLDSRVPPDRIRSLERRFNHGRVTFYSVNKRRFLERIVYYLKALQSRGKEIKLKLLCDLGLPINRFIDGLRKDSENIKDIHPSVAEVLGVQASCRRFDVLAVRAKQRS